MKILHISDTHSEHGKLGKLPEADILIHSGDFTMAGAENEILDFLNWFLDLPYKHKVLIAGNHEDGLYDNSIEGLDANCHILNHSSVEIEGLKIYGVPMFLPEMISGDYEKKMALIPTDTDILVTHQPPLNILDFDGGIHYGSAELAARVNEVKPRLHLFGHIHAQHGAVKSGQGTIFRRREQSPSSLGLCRARKIVGCKPTIFRRREQSPSSLGLCRARKIVGCKPTIFLNSSLVDSQYNLVHKPQRIELDL